MAEYAPIEILDQVVLDGQTDLLKNEEIRWRLGQAGPQGE
jgi:hypothetical protein